MNQYGDDYGLNEYDQNEIAFPMDFGEYGNDGDIGSEYGGPIRLLGENDLLRTEFAVMTMMIVAMCCAVGCVIGVITGFVSYGIMDKVRESTAADHEPDKIAVDEENG